MRRVNKRSCVVFSVKANRIANSKRLYNKSSIKNLSYRSSLKIIGKNQYGLNNSFKTSSVQSSLFASNNVFISLRAFATDLPSHDVLELPALSPTMNTGGILSWAVNEGDEVQEGDVLAEVETDKTNINWTTTVPGFIAKIIVPAGTSNIPLGAPCAILARKKEDVAKFKDYVPPTAAPAQDKKPTEKPKAAAPSQPAAATPSQTAQPTAPKGDTIFASPFAKKTAKEKGVDLSQITGTGPKGRIIAADVLEFTPSAVQQQVSIEPPKGIRFTDIPASGMRKVIAARLTESKQTIPHYYLTIECNVDKLLKIRKELNGQGDGKYKLSVNDFVIKAAALALKQVPEVNSAWGGDFIRRYEDVDISVAVQTPDGLFTPIVSEADKRGLGSISNRVKELAGKAKEKKLAPEEYQGGTFTISNLGMFGIKEFAAVINPPQSSILAVGATEKKVVVDESKESDEINLDTAKFKVVNVVNVTLSCDHRVVDGAVGARWLSSFKEFVEDPIKMLL